MEKLCLNCSEAHGRPRSHYCSQACSRAHKQRTVPKKCAVCSLDFYSRGRTCSPEHALELKKITNREKFGSDWAIQSSEAKEKRIATNLEKYGVSHPLKTEESLKRLRETNKIRYGVDYAVQNAEVKKKSKLTNIERYGVENPFQSSDIQELIRKNHLKIRGVEYPSQDPLVKKKIQDTNIERYGAENTFASEEIKEKIRLQNLERYGVEYPAQREEVKKKISETNLARYGVTVPFQAESVKAKSKLTNLEKRGFQYPSQSPLVMEKIQKSYRDAVAAGDIILTGRISKFNREIAMLMEERFQIKTVLEAVSEAYSFDIGVEGTNIYVELNPSVSHNSLRSFTCLRKGCEDSCVAHKPTARDYHQKRAIHARAKGLRLIQIYQWEFSKIELLLSGKLGKNFKHYSARKLRLAKLSKNEANLFLKQAHSQGAVNGQTHLYGLFKENELLAVATFGPARFGAKEQYEWLRYAVKPETIIHGGPQRLFQQFIQETAAKTVISYVDFNHSTGPSFLESIGFNEDKPTAPALVWSRKDEKISNNSLIRQGADRLLGTSYGSIENSGLNNKEIMAKEGFLPIYTAGNRIFRWKASS